MSALGSQQRVPPFLASAEPSHCGCKRRQGVRRKNRVKRREEKEYEERKEELDEEAEDEMECVGLHGAKNEGNGQCQFPTDTPGRSGRRSRLEKEE